MEPWPDGRYVRAPEHRQELLADLQELKRVQSIAPRCLEALCGKMNWVAQVMWGAITFVRNLLNLLTPPASGALPESLQLDAAANRHLDYWIARLSDASWKGSWIFPADFRTPVVTFKSDASGDKMWGYYFGAKLHWCTPVEDELPVTHIQFRELIPLAHAALEYGHTWTNSVVRVGVDNSSVGYAVNRGNSKDVWMQNLLEIISEASRRCCFVFLAVHTDRRFNALADMCTRFQVLDDFAAVLPPGVALPNANSRWRSVCRHSSPASSSKVFSLQLQLCAKTASR